jgi:MoxR-like ATPase
MLFLEKKEMDKFKDDVEAIEALREKYILLKNEISKKIFGQEEVIKQAIISIISGGHLILEGVPGLAKTMLVNTIAQVLGLKYKRIQFTPDLMPSDIIGTEILGKDREFKFIKGPIFANIILADEINRTPPKTQAALLEAMQEKAVTAAGQTYTLEAPFFVMATENPIEQEGTYPLPEAQLDRFMFKTVLDYPSFEEEIEIVKNTTAEQNIELKQILSAEEILYFQKLINRLPINDNILKYAVELVSKTRPNTVYSTDFTNKYLNWGAGPRASQYLIIGAKVHSILNKKYTPDIEDVRAIAIPVLRHRLIKNFRAEAEAYTIEDIIKKLL